jgi:anti-sigma factor RsiW
MSVVSFEQHQCKKINSYLDSYLNDELLVETNHEVLKHLENCNDCAQALEDRARIKNLLQQAARREIAPDRLRERIQRDIRQRDGSALARVSFNASARWAFAAAAMIAIVIGSWAAINSFSSRKAARLEAAVEQSATILNIGLEDHINCAIVHGQANRHFSPEQMAAKMGADYAGLAPVVKENAPAGYDVVVAHKCYVNKREFIHMILKNQENVLSLIITKKNGEAFPQAAAAAIGLAAGEPLYEARIQDYETAGFETRDYLGFIVSNLDKGDHLQIASSIAPAVRDFLVKMEA